MAEPVNDPHDMINETSRIVDDLEKSTSQLLRIPKMEFDNILVCGMGGSAIGGDIVADCLAPVSKVPVKVIRFPMMPNWADEHSLVVVSSYSGNTRETLEVYSQAIKKNCKVVAVTSGGQLMKECGVNNTPCVAVKTGIQPRNAVGYTVGYMFNIIATVGGPDILDDIRKCIPSLRKYVNVLKQPDGEPKKIAAHIRASVPVIYSTSNLYSVAGRWRAQCNENSKIIAFDGHIPDTNHNDILGFTKECGVGVKPVLLVEDSTSKLMRDLVNATISTFRNNGIKPYVVRISGKTVIERVFRAMLLGDFISLHLAFFKDIDPSDVSSIKTLKDMLAAKLALRARKKASKKRK